MSVMAICIANVLRYGIASSSECTPIYIGWKARAETGVPNSRGTAEYTPILYSILCSVKAVICGRNGGIITMYKTLYKHINV